jgi:hypothetical protein
MDRREHRREAMKWEAMHTLRERVEELWNDLSSGHRAKYLKAARSETQRYEQELREYKTLEKKAISLREDLEDLGAACVSLPPPPCLVLRQPPAVLCLCGRDGRMCLRERGWEGGKRGGGRRQRERGLGNQER